MSWFVLRAYDGGMSSPYSMIVEGRDISGRRVFLEHLSALGICFVPIGTTHNHNGLLLSNFVSHHGHSSHRDKHAHGQI